MSHQLAYLIARQRTAELQHAAARQRPAREASPRRPRAATPRAITRLATRPARQPRVGLTPGKGR